MNKISIELPIFDHSFQIPEGPKRNAASRHLLLILGCMVYSQALRERRNLPVEALLPPDELPEEYLQYGFAANDD